MTSCPRRRVARALSGLTPLALLLSFGCTTKPTEQKPAKPTSPEPPSRSVATAAPAEGEALPASEAAQAAKPSEPQAFPTDSLNSARLSGTGSVVCWERTRSHWTCRDSRHGEPRVIEEKASQIVVGPYGERCVHEPSGRWRCSGMARQGLVGPGAGPLPGDGERGGPYFQNFATGFDHASLVRSASWYLCGITGSSVSCSGVGSSGELGGPTKDSFSLDTPPMALSTRPVQVPGTTGATDVVLLERGACALTEPEGRVVCWGNDEEPWLKDPCFDQTGKVRGRPLQCQPRRARTLSQLPALRRLVSGSVNLMAGLDHKGHLYTWVGEKLAAPPTKIPDIAGATLLAIEHLGPVCVAQSNRVRCLEISGVGRIPVEELNFADAEVTDYPLLAGATELIVSSGHPCIRTANGAVLCARDPSGNVERLD